PKDKTGLHRHGQRVPTDSTQSRAGIPPSLPTAYPRPIDCPRETPRPEHLPGPTRPPAGQIREPVSFRRERPQDFPPALAAPDLVERGREPCAAFRPHLSNYNQNSFQSATGQTTLLANLARG